MDEGYALITRPTETIAIGADGMRIGSFDRTAGASRGTIQGCVVARSYEGLIAALEDMA